MCEQTLCTPVSEFPFNDHRRGKTTALYYCVGCASAHFTHEPRTDVSLSWHLQVRERNTAWSQRLLSALRQHCSPARVIDVGCGIGTWLNYLRSQHIEGLGFDTGKEAVHLGIDEYKLDLRADLFNARDAGACAFQADLLTAIMVFEHLREPRLLAKEMSDYCVRFGSRLYVTVPWFEEIDDLNFDQETGQGSVFNDVGAHVTYFSRQGMEKMFRGYGMRMVSPVERCPWPGLLFERDAQQQ